MSELKLTQIWIYPVKSLGGISLPGGKVTGKGLQYDRRWMLVDEEGKFITQRVYPEMALFHPSLSGTRLTITHGTDAVDISLDQPPVGEGAKVQIWDDVVTAIEVSRAHSEWFSDHLKMKCQLVYFPEENERPVDPVYKVNDEHVSLADGYPFLIIGQSSLDDLNSKLATAIPINRFRPNLVFSGGEPYEEDLWRDFSVGNTRFVGVKPCARCVLTTVDPDTGEKGTEPLRTLATYRRRDNKIYFGQNLVALDHSDIHVGDLITLKNP